MGTYVANTAKQQQEILEACGYKSFDDMLSVIPDNVILKDMLNIDKGVSELEISNKMKKMASKNKVFNHIFRGAGAYNHYIPAIVNSVTNKEDFVTAYTPYQAEISQGNLQAIFEFQTMMCELTGLDAANASVYDGAAAAAEAMFMCVERKKTKVLVSATADPEIIGTIKTYCYARDTVMEIVPAKDGVTDVDALKAMADGTTACFYMQQPNFCGIVEDAEVLGNAVHEAGGKFVMGCNPIALAVIKSPAECGADVAVGEGQPLGMPLSFGGPFLGFMTATTEMLRKLPGRIVGQTTDTEGNRGFVLTLQAREQHIRREKASSNICSNQALCALKASVYLSAMGFKGLEQVANLSMSHAYYLKAELEKIGFKLTYNQDFFHEFLMDCPVDSDKILTKLEENGYLGGLPVDGNKILWCTTELCTKEIIDDMIALIGEVL